MLILKEMTVWADAAGVAEVEPGGVPVWTRGWARRRRDWNERVERALVGRGLREVASG